jgi:hypothetical protein
MKHYAGYGVYRVLTVDEPEYKPSSSTIAILIACNFKELFGDLLLPKVNV